MQFARSRSSLRAGARPPRVLYVEEQMSPVEAAEQELVLGERVLAALPFAREELLYARIDVLPGPKVLEVELTEPSLFIGYAEGAAERFAAAIAAASQRRRIAPRTGRRRASRGGTCAARARRSPARVSPSRAESRSRSAPPGSRPPP